MKPLEMACKAATTGERFMTDLTVQTLLDRAEISDVFSRYAMGVDTRDWALFRTCFCDDVEADFSSLWPGAIYHGADHWVATAQSLIDGMDATQHIITNHTHDIRGDVAHSTSYLHAQHVFRNEFSTDQWIVAGYYTYTMKRTSSGWKISKYSLTVTWGNGNSAVFDMADKRMKARAAAA
jgi:hypothetical protein